MTDHIAPIGGLVDPNQSHGRPEPDSDVPPPGTIVLPPPAVIVPPVVDDEQDEPVDGDPDPSTGRNEDDNASHQDPPKV